MTTATATATMDLDLDGLGGQEARTFGASGFPRVYFVSKHADYEDTPLEQGGFFVDSGDDRVKMAEWGTAFDIKRETGSQSVRGSRSLPCVILGITPTVRRMILYSMADASKAIGHVDIAPKLWRDELGGDAGKYKKASPHSSIYLVPKAQPDQVFEMKAKGGNVVAGSEIARQIYYAVEMFSQLNGRPKGMPLADFALWHSLSAGAWLKYPERVNPETGVKESGGRTHLSLAWPMIENVREFQRRFLVTDAWGQKIDGNAEWRSVKELLTPDVLKGMWVGRERYMAFEAMKAELDAHVAKTHRVCTSEAEVRNEIERVYQESMRRGNPSLGAAGSTGGDAPARSSASAARPALLKSRDSYEAMLTSFRTTFMDDPDKADMPALVVTINGQMDLRGLPNRAEPTFKSITNCLKILREHAEINDPKPEPAGVGMDRDDDEIDF